MSMRSSSMAVLAALLLSAWQIATGAAPERLVISVPGPRNISYLPIDLIPKIGADSQEGVQVELLHTGGGAVALQHLVTRNADFAVAGTPAVMSLRANGGDVVVVAPVDDSPLFVLMVRAGLKGKVKRIADLKGMVVGVNTSTHKSKTTSQQLAEMVLASEGVMPNMVRIVPAGQSWEEQSSLMISGAADAVMGDEPFATRLLADGKVFFLANLAEPATAARIAGANFLHAAVATRGDVIRDSPEKVERMTRMLRTTLRWIADHKPEDVLDKLGVTDAQERASLLQCLRKYPRVFSRDGRFSASQLKETEHFFHTSSAGDAKGKALSIESMIDSRWVGLGK